MARRMRHSIQHRNRLLIICALEDVARLFGCSGLKISTLHKMICRTRLLWLVWCDPADKTRIGIYRRLFPATFMSEPRLETRGLGFPCRKRCSSYTRLDMRPGRLYGWSPCARVCEGRSVIPLWFRGTFCVLCWGRRFLFYWLSVVTGGSFRSGSVTHH